ncbi:uncharacterized protein TNCV_4888661 [Trichonephila clavipes]|nr:uncharacterized protein TNCV_4888661 [Trichonephila clavipes]
MKGSQQNIVDESKYNIFLNGRLNLNVALFSYTRALGDVILNHGQVTWTTPELSPNSHTRPTGGGFSSRQIERCPTRRVLSGTGLDLATRQTTVRCYRGRFSDWMARFKFWWNQSEIYGLLSNIEGVTKLSAAAWQALVSGTYILLMVNK